MCSFADFTTHTTFGNVFVTCYCTFLVIALATTVSFLVNKSTVESIKLQHSWKEQLSCSSVDEGTVPPIKNSEHV